ncbi:MULTISPECIES: hypothetical protein [unclassified Pseudomonas]
MSATDFDADTALGRTSFTLRDLDDNGQERKPICPIPASATNNDEYYGYGAGYYAIEQVADFPVIIGSKCFIARMND